MCPGLSEWIRAHIVSHPSRESSRIVGRRRPTWPRPSSGDDRQSIRREKLTWKNTKECNQRASSPFLSASVATSTDQRSSQESRILERRHRPHGTAKERKKLREYITATVDSICSVIKVLKNIWHPENKRFEPKFIRGEERPAIILELFECV